MKCVWLGALLFGGLLFAGNQDSEFNVNTRYTVDGVLVNGDGWSTTLVADHSERISSPLRREILALLGEKLNPAVLDDLATRLRKEFHARVVERHLLRGKSPETVQVVFDVKLRPTRFDVAVPKFLYQDKGGFSGAVEANAIVKQHTFTAGLVSDGDELLERYSGVTARYSNNRLGTDCIHFDFDFASYHEQWEGSTLMALSAPHAQVGAFGTLDAADAYRSRVNFEPLVTFVVSAPVKVSVGASFETIQEQYPYAHSEAANALVAAVRYHRRLEGSDITQDLDGGYDLRNAFRGLRSDFVYGRHRWEFRYMLSRGKEQLIEDSTGGFISGQAPLYERFVLGNASTLRGWNKFEIDPLGGTRMVHNSVEYRNGAFQVFFDSGAVWDNGQAVQVRNSAGVGLREGPFSAAVAFPLREGHVEPIFMLGMNY